MKTGSVGSAYYGATLVLAAAATLVATFLIGSLILPPAAADPAGADIRALSGSQALVAVSGDIAGIHVLGQLNVEEYNEDTSEGDPIDLNLTFRGEAATLLIRAEQLTLGTPTEARVIAALGADTFYSEPGICTVELATIDYIVLEPTAVRIGPPRGQPIPEYNGMVTCTNISNLQGDVVVSIEAVFQYRPEDSLLS